jgi:hypothetical protein
MAPVAERLSSQHEALSSNSELPKFFLKIQQPTPQLCVRAFEERGKIPLSFISFSKRSMTLQSLKTGIQSLKYYFEFFLLCIPTNKVKRKKKGGREQKKARKSQTPGNHA